MSAPWKDVVLENVPTGPVAARIYNGEGLKKAAPIVLYLHGGAFLDTEHATVRPVAASLAEAGVIVVAADYTSGNQNAFPQVLECAYGILAYLSNKRNMLELGGAKKSLLFVAGEESGGNVAAGVALKARDQMPGSLDGQVLISPLLDPFMGSKSFLQAEESGMRERWTEGWNRYLGFLGGVCHPYAAPRYCSRLSGLAPALVLTAEDDPLRDESMEYGRRLKEAGVRVRQQVLPAGTGWPTLYGGQSKDKPSWQQDVCCSFKGFVEDVQA
ncbi:alpha/beta hydrolase [Rhizobium sp. ICMP 5592]|jgi:acetyl esterase/lipase|uniref:alpha/beta hydrolase fold domain-containing protein n=1 Tax=unclassified Rhizobium TaxID=2613769 RepID=UPI0012955209|nr:alpha/beta hydrolase [Rhizobium sp. ICMP 5592]MQB42130.1 alpha/beta hydrolase [Rhizobium sp. ICMP 5592]